MDMVSRTSIARASYQVSGFLRIALMNLMPMKRLLREIQPAQFLATCHVTGDSCSKFALANIIIVLKRKTELFHLIALMTLKNSLSRSCKQPKQNMLRVCFVSETVCW